MNLQKPGIAALLLTCFSTLQIHAQTDTLHVLSYNLLYLGDTPPCQGPHSAYEGYLETVIAYANPDIAGLVKMEAIPVYSGDESGSAPTGYADSLLEYSFNAANPGRYNYCTFTNASGADNISLLFYNQQKLGFADILCSYSNITDFDTYKLYYKSTDLATTHDTVFVYVTLNHDESGTGTSATTARGEQIQGELNQLYTHFSSFPNMINMGDFNTHSSTETCYQAMVAPSNAAYKYYDPPFYPDATYSYPANWDDNPSTYTAALTVSTRLSTSNPNGCSTDVDGAKSWYDHIFLSSAIINNTGRISYVPHSFRVIGNDGKRNGIAVNATPTNTSAPTAVVNDIFQLSEHYPIALDLLVNTTDNAVASVPGHTVNFALTNPVYGNLILHAGVSLAGQTLTLTVTDMPGRQLMRETIADIGETVSVPCHLQPGMYCLTVTAADKLLGSSLFVKE